MDNAKFETVILMILIFTVISKKRTLISEDIDMAIESCERVIDYTGDEKEMNPVRSMLYDIRMHFLSVRDDFSPDNF